MSSNPYDVSGVVEESIDVRRVRQTFRGLSMDSLAAQSIEDSEKARASESVAKAREDALLARELYREQVWKKCCVLKIMNRFVSF